MGCCGSKASHVAATSSAKPSNFPETTPSLVPAETPEDVLRFWYRGAYPEHPELTNDGDYIMTNIPRWMLAQQNMDQEATVVVSNLIHKLGKGDFKDEADRSRWWNFNDGLLAQILCLDQLTRNCFRGKADAYAYDDVSRRVAEQILANVSGDEKKLVDQYAAGDCLWIAVCLQHTEDLSLHDMEFKIFDAVEARHPSMEKVIGSARKFGKEHKDVLERFGRYPHRNAQLGRESTLEEKTWLNDFENLPLWAKSQVMAEGAFNKHVSQNAGD